MSTMTGTLAARIAALDAAIGRLHAAGLDSRYDDLLLPRDAEGADAMAMARGSHYDYRAQTWRDGHDHAHIVTNDDTAPLLFCGADVMTCVGLEL
jgi:hypothetical protein